MGNLSSTPSTTTTTTMSSSTSPQSPIEESSDPKLDTNTPQAPIEKPNDGEEEKDDGECGFCVFMKGGGCRDAFIDWEKCVEEGEKNNEDVVERCFQVTSVLTKCMQAHSDYYEPILKVEKAARVEAVKELEKEKERLDVKGEVSDGSRQEKES